MAPSSSTGHGHSAGGSSRYRDDADAWEAAWPSFGSSLLPQPLVDKHVSGFDPASYGRDFEPPRVGKVAGTFFWRPYGERLRAAQVRKRAQAIEAAET